MLSTSGGASNDVCQSVLSSVANRPCLDAPPSPAAPSPEPLSPVLKEKEFGSTTYRLVIGIGVQYGFHSALYPRGSNEMVCFSGGGKYVLHMHTRGGWEHTPPGARASVIYSHVK